MESNNKNITFEQLISACEPKKDNVIELEFDEFDMYSFPYEDEVPEGDYASIITDIRSCHNRNGELCYDVYYKIFSLITYNAYNMGKVDTITYHYIRQRYKRNSDAYRNFHKAMQNCCNLKKITNKDIIGVIEVFSIIYRNTGSLGSIEERSPATLTENWFAYDTTDAGVLESEDLTE